MSKSRSAALGASSQRIERLRGAVARFESSHRSESRLWDHQASAMSAVNAFLKDSIEKLSSGKPASGAIIMPTGAGKTALAAEIVKAMDAKALILSPTVRIALQHYEELKERAPELDVSLFYADSKDLGGKVIVTTYQSALALFSGDGLPDDIDIVFYDEAHRSISARRSELHGNLGLVEIGLTATPAYNEKRHIWTAFEKVIYEMGIREAVELGILAPLRGFVIETNVDLRSVRLKIGREFLNEVEAEKHLNIVARNRTARDFYLDSFKGVPTVAFCITKRHAEEFAAFLRGSGVKTDFIHSGLTNDERESRLKAFEDGSLDLITTRDVLIEGWDSKRAVLELNLRPTFSRVVKTHMVGRVARMRPGKESGIVAEFQDIYQRSQQPLHIYHLLEAFEYRQGGLVIAPEERIAQEKKKLDKMEEVRVIGDLSVSYKVKKVMELEPSKVDFTDIKLLREIVETGKGFDPLNISRHDFMHMNFDHPKFKGTGTTLLHKTFGIRHVEKSQLNLSEDVQNFLWFVFEDEMSGRCTRISHPEYVIGLSFGESEYLRSPDELADTLSLAKEIRKVISTLTPRQEEVVRKLFGIGESELSLRELGQIFGVGHERVRQIGNEAIRRMRYPSRAESIEQYASVKDPYPMEKKMDDILHDPSQPSHIRQDAGFWLAEKYLKNFREKKYGSINPIRSMLKDNSVSDVVKEFISEEVVNHYLRERETDSLIHLVHYWPIARIKALKALSTLNEHEAFVLSAIYNERDIFDSLSHGLENLSYARKLNLFDILKEACSEGSDKIVEKIISSIDFAQIGETLAEPLYLAFRNRKPAIMKMLREKGASFGSSKHEYLRRSSQDGDIDIVNFLLDEGAGNLEARHGEALAPAAARNHFKMVKVLVERIDYSEHSLVHALDSARLLGRTEIEEYLRSAIDKKRT